MDTDQLNDYELWAKYIDVQELCQLLSEAVAERRLMNKPYVMWSHERPANVKLRNAIREG